MVEDRQHLKKYFWHYVFVVMGLLGLTGIGVWLLLLHFLTTSTACR